MEKGINFFKEVKSEFKKVTWPNKKQVVKATSAVITFVAIMTIFVSLADGLFSNLIKLLLK